MVRSARAIRPCRPITLPTSASATCRRRTSEPSSPSTSSTRTPPGSSTSRRARSASSSPIELGDALRLEQLRDRGRRLRALAEPLLDLRLVELDQRGLGLGVVASDDLDELAVARRARVGRDDAVDRVLL